MQFRTILWVPAALAMACGGEGGNGSGNGEAGTAGILTLTGAGSGGESESASEGESESESDSNSGSGPSGSGPSASGSGTSPDGPRFDLGLQPDANLGCGGGGKGGGGGGAPEFSFIWIANSDQGTVSKIDTQTMVEEGRYIVRDDSIGNPSRTSVNLNGDVAVANRSGGVTMIAATPEACPAPANTSTGSADIKPWPDGCVTWYTPFNYASQRPVAWTAGEFDNSTCRYENTKLWTSGANATIDVLLLDGETGVVEQTIPIAGVEPSFYGIYGAAVDSEGNFWGSQLGTGQLINVSLSDFSVKTWPMPTGGYGMTVDHLGYVWTCSSSVARFDPVTETWQQAAVGGQAGCMEDGNGTLWLANDPMIGVDINTLAVTQTIDLPNYVHGISIDFYGYVWGPAIYNDEAYRVDPVTGQIDTVTGFDYPYTYSDMTGFALRNVGGPSG